MRNFSEKDFAKYLGVYFDNNLNWKKHIKMTNIKVNKGVGTLRKICDFLQEKHMKNLCNVFIKPFTKYDLLAWAEAPKTHLIKIKRSLNKAVTIMLFKGKFESAQPLFQYLNNVQLHLNINLQQSKFMKKFILCRHLDSIQKCLPITYSTSINNTNNTKLILPYYRTSAGVSSLFYLSFRIWNNVPKNIQVSLINNICRRISKIYLTTNDVIYTCVSLCKCVQVYTCKNTHVLCMFVSMGLCLSL